MAKKQIKKQETEFYSGFYTMYIYLVLIINVIISIVKFVNTHKHSYLEKIKELSFNFSIIYISIILFIFILALKSYFQSDIKSKKELLKLFLSLLISFLIVPYFINNILMLLAILGIIALISFFLFVPDNYDKAKNKSKSSSYYGGIGDPIVKRYNKKAEVYRKGQYVYVRQPGLFGTDDKKVCYFSDLESGFVHIYVDEKRVKNPPTIK